MSDYYDEQSRKFYRASLRSHWFMFIMGAAFGLFVAMFVTSVWQSPWPLYILAFTVGGVSLIGLWISIRRDPPPSLFPDDARDLTDEKRDE